MAQPNIIERLENLVAALDEASETLTAREGWDTAVLNRIDDAAGIAEEILTMVDGR